jgi:hypothetical protein
VFFNCPIWNDILVFRGQNDWLYEQNSVKVIEKVEVDCMMVLVIKDYLMFYES